ARGGAAASVYRFGYSAHYDGRYSLRLLGAMFNVLLLSLAVQVLADHALTFLVTWEARSLSASLLVLVEHDQHGAVLAANWYLAVTHAGFAALVAAFLVLAGGDMTGSFAAMRSATLPPATRNVVFLLALVGFGTKAGVIPLHVWLPMAHPVAPSHVSALLSGVVIKMGVYGLMRVALDLLGGGPPRWGGGVLGLGSVSAPRTRKWEQLGGLSSRMPRTAACLLVGAAAISALPPLNGFASEWLVFQTLMGGALVPHPEAAIGMAIAVAMLALTSGLAVACFVKAFGITFLALPRSAEAERAREVPASMQVGMLVLVGMCVALGLTPFLVVPVLSRALAGLGGLPLTPIGFSLRLPFSVSGVTGEMSPLLVGVGVLLLGTLTAVVLRGVADRRLRIGDTWRCGRVGQTPR